MDDDVKAAFDDLRGELKELARARTPATKREAERDVRDAREDLEDVLRREGYRLSRRELDAMIDEREERRFNERLDKRLAELAEGEEGEGEEGEGDEGEGEEGKPAKKKAAAKKPAAVKDEEDEWT